ELEPRDTRAQRARLCPDTLGVREMTRVVISDCHRQRMPRGDGPEVDQELRHVAYFACEPGGPFGPARLVPEQPAVILHRRAAPRSIDDDGIDIDRLERLDQPFGESDRLRFASDVQ